VAKPFYKMTRAEVKEWDAGLLDEHRRAVEKAMSWARHIRPEVVADYPDLAAQVCGCGKVCRGYTLGETGCAGCWEVESRLEDYLRSLKGQRFVLDLLLRMGLLCDPQDFYLQETTE
jgi:hypothetical protein